MNKYTELLTVTTRDIELPYLPRVEISSSRKITLSIYGIRACGIYINLFFLPYVNKYLLTAYVLPCYNTKYRDGTEPSINKLQVGTPGGKVTGVRG